MNDQKIAILGGGNLGVSLAEGFIKNDFIAPSHVFITRRRLHLLEPLKQKGVQVLSNNLDAVEQADIIILAIKPHQIKNLLHEIKGKLQPGKHILISVVTGINFNDIQEIVDKEITLFLAMPNTAISIQESMTCLATRNASQEQQDMIVSLFNRLGKAIVIPEELMEAATVLGACGIAYALRYIRASSQGGIEIGFSSQVAQLIAAQTVKGAAALLIEGGQHPEHEIDKVTTPQGCTIAGLNEMEHQGFSSSLIKGILTSYGKIAKIEK
ncbi:MAG: pyrroline-5-carboxylate reductase [Candidatus Cyclobacteriaceae bacterium M3_2C_046]